MITGPVLALVLLGVGALAGIVSTVASLASVVSYPALIALGLPPVTANVTNTVALMFTGLGAAAGSRPELAGQRRTVLRLGLVTAVGGGAGAAVLLLTPPRGFEYAAPVLIAAGSVLILVARGRPPAAAPPAAAPPAAGRPAALPGPATPTALGAGRQDSRHPVRASRGAWVALLAVSCYIGYFGAAGGIMLLAVLIRMLDLPLARVNAVKNVVSGMANAVAGIGFALFGPVRWTAVLPLAAGFLAGGWVGPAIVRRLPPEGLRAFIGCCGLVLAVRLGLSAYR